MGFNNDVPLNVFHSLYLFQEGRTRDGLRADPLDRYLEVAQPLIYGELIPREPVRFLQSKNTKGSRLYDVIFTGYPSTKLVSERVTQTLSEAGFSGWSTFPISLSWKNGEEISGYSGLAVTGRAGVLDDERCPIVEELSPWTGKQIHSRKGYYFDPESWDGSDFFFPRGTTLMIVTERVKVLFEKSKFKNTAFQRLSEVSRVVMPAKQ